MQIQIYENDEKANTAISGEVFINTGLDNNYRLMLLYRLCFIPMNKQSLFLSKKQSHRNFAKRYAFTRQIVCQ